MVYGIISQLDDATTSVFFRTKKIVKENVYTANQLSSICSPVMLCM